MGITSLSLLLPYPGHERDFAYLIEAIARPSWIRRCAQKQLAHHASIECFLASLYENALDPESKKLFVSDMCFV